MGPAKGSRTITKITIKGYEEQQHHEDPTSSSKVKLKKRKMSELGPQWSNDELMRFYEAYHQHGKDWKKVGAAVATKSADMVEALYSMHRTFLSLPESEATAMGFIALVSGHHNVVDKFSGPRKSDQMARAPGKTQKRGEATLQIGTKKVKEAPFLDHFYSEKQISGFSCSFKKEYYGVLVRNTRSHPVGKRTPRVPIILSMDRNDSDDGVVANKNSVNSTTKANEEITNNNFTSLGMKGYSPEGSSGITEATKFVQGHILLETKGIRYTEIFQTQECLEKRRNEQSMKEDHTSRIEHDITMLAKEENTSVDSQNLPERLNGFFSPEEMLVLDVLQNLVNVPTKMPQPKINTASELGTLGKEISTLSHKRKKGHSPVDQSKLGKQVDKYNASRTVKKKRKKLLVTEVSSEEQNISSGNNLVLSEARQIDTTECSSLNSESERSVMDLPKSTANISTGVYLNAPREVKPDTNMPRKSKRKLKVRYRTKDVHCVNQWFSCSESADNLQESKLLHCLSSDSLRRWCACEWFYSAIDYPWFMNNEFVNYLNFANLSHLSRLTRSEWSTIRSSLGKPRRFSNYFLTVEKEKLEDYREKVRTYYALLRDGLRDSLPVDLARPFSIGQWVIVRHPSTREICNGKVLMMRHDCYKIKFDQPDLGVELVKDTDCMPVNWSDNLPEDFQKRGSFSNNMYNKMELENFPKLALKENWDHIMNGVSISEPSKSLHVISDELPKVNFQNSDIIARLIPSELDNAAERTLYGQSYELTQQKEAATTNNGFIRGIELGVNQKDGNMVENCKNQFARTSLEPSEDVNWVHSALDSERLSNKSTSDRYEALLSLQSDDDTRQSNNNSHHDYELVSYVTAFVQSSVSEARQMVDAVVQAISENGIDFRDEETSTSSQSTNCTGMKSQAAITDTQLPSKLILNCVATIVAIMHLSEARHPPANVAGVLEHAASMLRPSCLENSTIYKEIENCVSIIKNLMLALVPTTSSNGNPSTLPL